MDNTIMTEIETRITNITNCADNLVILSRGFSDLHPEAEGSLLCIADTIRENANKVMDLYMEDLRGKKSECGQN